METFYRSVLVLHVVAGSVGLAAMSVPLLSRKGARRHRRGGRLFMGAMGLASVTGVVLALSWIAMPGVIQAGVAVEQLRVDALFLMLIAALTSNAVVQSVFALRQRGRSRPHPSLVVVGSLLLLAATSVGSLVLGILSARLLPLVFGGGALALLARDVRFTFAAVSSEHAYLYQHIRAAGIACISATTAFLVLGGRRWLSLEMLGDSVILLWILPGALLGPIFQRWIVSYRRKLEGTLQTRNVVATARATPRPTHG
jgi:hypothetical protein